MIGLVRDVTTLSRLFRTNGFRHMIDVSLFALRARLMRRSDRVWERSVGITIDESDVCLDSLDINSPNKEFGFSYVPCPQIAVKALLQMIGGDFTKFRFIDFGSGEGRSLLVASTYQFEEVIGVEFAKELHDAAVCNIRNAKTEAARRGRIRSIHMDAASFEIPKKDCVLYFYNPFGEEVFRQVLQNIERVYRECRPKFYVIFYQTRASIETDHTSNAELLRAASFLEERPVRFQNWWTRFLLGSQDHYLFESK